MKIRKTIKNSVSSNLKSTLVNQKEIKDLVNEKIQDLLGFNQKLMKCEINLKMMKNKYQEKKDNYNLKKEHFEETEKCYYQKYQDFFSENNNFLNDENESHLNNSHEDSHKGLLKKLKEVKEKINKKIELISTAENELNTMEQRAYAKYEKLSEKEKEQIDKWEKEYFLNNPTDLEDEINNFKNTLPILNFDNLIDDLNRSASSIRAKSSAKNFDLSGKHNKSFENSPKTFNDNSINYEKSIESFNKLNVLSSITNMDNDFPEDERFKKLKETQYNILAKSDNELLTHDIDYLLTEIKNLEKKSNEMLDKKAITEENFYNRNFSPEIKLKVESDFISFKQVDEKIKENKIHSSNEKKAEHNKSVAFSLKKSNLLAREEIAKKSALEHERNNKSFNLIKSNKSKELLNRDKDNSIGNTPKTVAKSSRTNYGINISLNSVKKNIINHIAGARDNSHDERSKNLRRDVLNYSDMKLQDSPIVKTAAEKLEKMNKSLSKKNLKFDDKKNEKTDNKSKIHSKNNSKSKNSSTKILQKNENHKSQNSFTSSRTDTNSSPVRNNNNKSSFTKYSNIQGKNK